ncbi:hypothetical protein [Streptomyces sp. NBC_01367]|uniref:hypothetical protein n=1 Tax=Streptomyces sp. NBC_01367 TaxID=2903841 RepID=UPI0032488AED
MTKILSRALGAAAVAGIATLALAAPAIAAPSDILGDNIDGVGVAAQNLSNNIGNQQAAVSHSQGVQNNAQQNNSDAQEVEILSGIKALNDTVIGV